MENDFKGLNASDSVSVKEELAHGDRANSGFAKSLGVPWSLKEHGGEPSKLKSGSDLLKAIYSQQLLDVKNFGGPDMNQQFPSGNPLVTTHPILPFGAPSARMAKTWIDSKTSCPAQLTIFYGGTVSVFNDISAEKAQAILFLAGSGYAPLNMVNQNMPPGSGLPSPVSVSSHHPIDQSGVPSANSDHKVSNGICMATALVNKLELHGAITSIGTLMSAAVPQARRASLARFLEKRRERVMNAAAPYKLSDKPTDSHSFSFSSATSTAARNSVTIIKDNSSDRI